MTTPKTLMIVGNWKLNHGVAETRAYLEAIPTGGLAEGLDAGVCPPFTSLPEAIKTIKTRGIPLGIFAQDCSHQISGAFTGEVSAKMLRELGVRGTLIGHSERRQHAGDTDEAINKKIQNASDAALEIIFCIGETRAQRESGKTESVLSTQLEIGLQGLQGLDLSKFHVAYEPVWAIGTGLTATAEQAQETQAFVRKRLTAILGSAGSKTRILYGGSVKADVAASLVTKPDVDGLLVGGASLKAADFLSIIAASFGRKGP